MSDHFFLPFSLFFNNGIPFVMSLSHLPLSFFYYLLPALFSLLLSVLLKISSKLPAPLALILEKIRWVLSKISLSTLLLHSFSEKKGSTFLRPGREEGSWQLWELPLKKEGSTQKKEDPLLREQNTPPPLDTSKNHWLIGVPTRDLMVIPLWVASDGNLRELVIMELSSKHLLRRGMREGLKVIKLQAHAERTLVVALAPVAIPSLATGAYLKKAQYFEAAARLLPLEDIDLIVWQELGEVCFGFVQQKELLWFSGSGESKVSASLIKLIQRMFLHLQAESILKKIPERARLIGTFSAQECHLLQGTFGLTPGLSLQNLEELPSPRTPSPLLDLPSEQACLERVLQAKKDRIKKIAKVAITSYFLLLFSVMMNVLFKETLAAHLTSQLKKSSLATEKAKQDLTQWQELRFAIDPTTYTLDLLAAVANQIHGEKIRLISFTGMPGRLQIAGEATDVSQAYRFLESMKTAPQLQEYQWTSSQPKLAGKNSVRFETEGSLPHAKTSLE